MLMSLPKKALANILRRISLLNIRVVMSITNPIYGVVVCTRDVAGHLSDGRAYYDPKEVFPKLVDRHGHRIDPGVAGVGEWANVRMG